ncbi:Beta-galactosidase trimerisation domain-containing protein [Pseudovibrio ascidiaceicola]|uniref:Beta-galactosidase trimerisation domain-containing protein n=1 Tax=Pseudovibrio ascidiaceicola TaxID=285279 RepID=A0A1I3ZEU9_9HYPH|nr:alpha-amylase family protein [Pseudovibrio ascidiaceicola]SFK42086.1 Beta-galactosidase trimerisation domain-containing protein [Pseudovibrio ascidiaceicola]
MTRRTLSDPLLLRQVHLDFHTGPQVPDIGLHFDENEFGDTLLKAGVQSITLFAKCHHGYSYHPTEVGKPHPNLKTNLLRRQIDACKVRGIATPIYLSCAWDELACHEHPEWRVVDEDGKWITTGGVDHLQGPSWGILDFGTSYLDYLCAQIEEVARLFPENDGIFLDICHQYVSLSSQSLDALHAKGLDWQNTKHLVQHAADMREQFLSKTTEAARCVHADLPVFHNHGHVTRGDRRILGFDSHLEIESLPTGGWGYEHFPVSARYAETIGAKYLGMTGKFHTFWGEFGTYKPGAALEQESAMMLAFGAGSSIGDQLHPSGIIDQTTYERIGQAFKLIEKRETYHEDSKGVAEIGILSAEAINDPYTIRTWPKHVPGDEGVVRLLLECQMQFDVLDRNCDISSYKLLILPDNVQVDADLKAKLNIYLTSGGKLLLSGRSGLDEDGFLFDVGAEYCGTSPFDVDYALLSAPEFGEVPQTPVCFYEGSQRIKVTDGISLGDVYEPYFARSIKHFCGHQHTPNRRDKSGYAVGVTKGPITYLAHSVFSIYMHKGPVVLLDALRNLIGSLLEEPMVSTTHEPMPGLRVILRHQPELKRYVLHTLFSTPRLRGQNKSTNIEVIQEKVRLRDISLDLKLPRSITGAESVDAGEVTLSTVSGIQRLLIGELNGHAVVPLSYA